MNSDLVFFDTILLQQDMRVRLPKSLIINIDGQPGCTRLNVYFDALTKEIILRPQKESGRDEGSNQNG